MFTLRIPVGMSDVVILLGSQRQADKATRRILSEAGAPPVGRARRGFGESRKRKGR